jgi:hypothetical protein
LKTEEYGLDYVAIYLCFKRGEILSWASEPTPCWITLAMPSKTTDMSRGTYELWWMVWRFERLVSTQRRVEGPKLDGILCLMDILMEQRSASATSLSPLLCFFLWPKEWTDLRMDLCFIFVCININCWATKLILLQRLTYAMAWC